MLQEELWYIRLAEQANTFQPEDFLTSTGAPCPAGGAATALRALADLPRNR